MNPKNDSNPFCSLGSGTPNNHSVLVSDHPHCQKRVATHMKNRYEWEWWFYNAGW